MIDMDLFILARKMEAIKAENEELRDSLMVALWLDITKPTPPLHCMWSNIIEYEVHLENYKHNRDLKIRQLLYEKRNNNIN